MSERELIQLEAIKAWKENNYKGTIILPTGTGKMYIACLVIDKLMKLNKIGSTCIIVPTINLIKQYEEEFDKWNLNRERVTFMCIQSAYKLEESYDLLVIDEIHTALSENYSKVFTNLKYEKILGLTATVPEDTTILDEYCPIVYRKELEEVKDLLSDFIIFNLPVKMNKVERKRYNVFNQLFNRANLDISVAKKLEPELKKLSNFDIAEIYSKLKGTNPLIKSSKQFWSSMSMRKTVCYESTSKFETIKKLIERFPGRKWILFNKSIKVAEQLKEFIGGEVYHSKMKLADREVVLDNFAKNNFNILIAVDALNAGLNVPDADAAINVSYTSAELTNIQRLGRVLRKVENKKALIINLFLENTVEERWLSKKDYNLKTKNVRSISDIEKWLKS